MNKSKFDLSGRTALITGGAGLLGYQHALALLACNADVVLTDINEDLLFKATKRIRAETSRRNVENILMDVTDENNVRNVSLNLKYANKKVDILINNAAIDSKVDKENNISNSSRLEKFEVADWDRQLAVGLKGAFICSKIFGHEMSLNGGGVILNIASDLSVIAPDQRLYSGAANNVSESATKPVTYSVIKHGLIGLTKYLATYWPDKNVRCNALSPGGVFNNQDSDFVNRIQNLIPLGRMAEVDEYQAAVQFLCSDASAYMTGQNLVLDGGRSVW